MAYTLVDILDKFISIEVYLQQMYTDIANSSVDQKIKNIASVFALEEKRHVTTYISLKRDIEGKQQVEIDFDLYDRISKITNEFSNNILKPETDNIKDLIQFMLYIEKENLALIIRIQDVLSSNSKRIDFGESVLEDLLREEEKHIKNLEMFVK
ncbi:hypothetical protein RH915_05985 [Serpentinicella sp. ANB-PHB4]|uniref:hypothetical protein n=1 Tax=Serpentinicella sp. ANB-PHB4 TaxID=3074076 RepID=UPI0028646E3D|nr:hypothetical protein [Serpentinicella sp. ANB-PHB4]MDR5659033.1 hypothetical protein [Serpentinicella sp. ANB-PHB4]